MAFHLYYHHQLEELAGMYLRHRQMKLEDFRQGDVLGKETVVVPTYGVAVWLEHHLVRAGVVSAGVDFPVMRNAISDLLHITMTEYEPEQFSRAALTWRIFTVFCQDGHASEFPEVLRNYLEAPGEQDPLLRKFEFAGVVAQLFEEYQSYLPQTLTRWGRGVDLGLVVRERDGNLQKLDENLRWQPWLWNRICNPEAGKHLVSLAEAIVRFGEASTATRPSYPVTVFGASAMPPAFLKVLVDYAKNATVNFYYRNPSREYW
ncbi:MAG: exodeoxyribonuclease V subunit gamma [Victivallales bacterium]|nr:exodeoxyribonuclease V subunit gamma [Victivallales bacterium]